MPRMPKYLKREWAFFLDERGRNEKFCGDALCQKTVTIDFFTHKSVSSAVTVVLSSAPRCGTPPANTAG